MQGRVWKTTLDFKKLAAMQLSRGETDTPRNTSFLRMQRLAPNRISHSVRIANTRKTRVRGLRSKKRNEARNERGVTRLKEKRKLYKQFEKDILTNPKLLGGMALHGVIQQWAQDTPKNRRAFIKERNRLLKEQFNEYYKQTRKKTISESIYGASKSVNCGETSCGWVSQL